MSIPSLVFFSFGSVNEKREMMGGETNCSIVLAQVVFRNGRSCHDFEEVSHTETTLSEGREWRDWMKKTRFGKEGSVMGTWHTMLRNVSQRFQRKFSGSLVVGSSGWDSVVKRV